MTVHALPTPAIAGCLADAHAAIAAALSCPTGRMTTTDLSEAVTLVAELENRVAALRLALHHEADQRDAADRDAATSTDAWLAALTGDRRELLSGGLMYARLLTEKYDATWAALRAGSLRLDQAKVIMRAGELAPRGATPEQIAEAEEYVVAKATGLANPSGRPINAKRLRHVARRMFEEISVDLANQHEDRMLTLDEHRARNEAWLELYDNGNGTVDGKFRIPELHASLLRTYLERLTSPRRYNRTAAGETVIDASTPQAQSSSEIRGQGFLELIEHLPTTTHAPSSVEIIVTMPLDALTHGLEAARLDTGVRISAGEARRLACEAGLIPLVLGGESQPLDVGRKQRLFTRAQRRVLATLHETCAIAGCERPFAWCEIHHHRQPWASGGRTDLANALPLCGFHHRKAHDADWELTKRGSEFELLARWRC